MITKRRLPFKRMILFAFGSGIIIVVAGVLFIKLNTEAAAELTDNVLRPMLGANTVIFLEKVFFNASDRVKQLASSEDIAPPETIGSDPHAGTEATNLALRNVPSIATFKPLRNEGLWKIIDLDQFPNRPVMATTFVRPDPLRPYALVTIAQMDMKSLQLGLVAGIKEPAGKIGKPGPGVVPADIQNNNSLVAAFDGGFQYRDGEYGMVVGDQTYLPLQKDLGTLVGYANGQLKIVDYQGEDLGQAVAFVRQNCPILVKDGENAAANIKNKKLWGRTMTTDIYTWRSGIGLTATGNLLFAVGNNLTPSTLAEALKMAGAKTAIQLDINPNWVRFNLFTPTGNGQYSSKPLTRDLKSGADEYLHGYAKDFFYLYKRA